MYVGDACRVCDVSRVKPVMSYAYLDLNMGVMVLCIFSRQNVEDIKAVYFETEIDGTVFLEYRVIPCICSPISALF